MKTQHLKQYGDTMSRKSNRAPSTSTRALKYPEVYARLILEHIDPVMYGGLIVKDKPDLIDYKASLGIEVTEANPQANKEADALYSEMQNSGFDATAHARSIERIEQLGGQVISGILFGPGGNDSFDLIMDAFKKKAKKLNKGEYEPLKHNHLFIFSWILADRIMLEGALCRFAELNALPIKFERVIVNVPGRNYDFDLVNQTVEEHPFGSREQFDIAEKAYSICKRHDVG